MKKKQKINRNKYYRHKYSANKIKKARNQLFSAVGITFSLLAIVFLTTKIYGFFTSSNMFKINQLELPGISGDFKLRVKRTIFLVSGDNYFLLNSKLVTKRLMALYPEIKNVKIEKYFPKKVVCKIFIRQPLSNIVRNNKIEKIDADGVIFDCIYQETLPEIKDVKNINTILEFLEWIRKNQVTVFQKISEINSPKENEIEILLRSGMKIFWGRNDLNIRAKKLARMNLVWNDCIEKKKEIEYVDLRFYPESGVVVMPKGCSVLPVVKKSMKPVVKTKKENRIKFKKANLNN